MKTTLPYTKLLSLLCVFLALSMPSTPIIAQTLSCALTAPLNGATYIAPTTIFLSATTTVPVGITIQRVEFYSGNTKIGQDNTSPYSIYWTTTNSGTYVVKAKVITTIGTQTFSATRTITVLPPAPPTVSLIAPANNATFAVNSNITLSASAFAGANSTLQRVKFYANGTLIGQDTTSPYSIAWANVAQGTYTIIAIAYSNNNTSTLSASRMITVNAATLPTVSLTQPTNGTTFTGVANVSLTATATAANGASITKVEFFVGSTKIGEDATSPYTYLWNSPTDGTSSLTAKATSSNGLIATSNAITITVNNNPTVIISSPTNNSTFAAPANFTIQAVPSTYNGSSVQKVEFFVDNNKVGEDISAPYLYNVTNFTVGTYSLTARATDSNNRQGLSTTTTINVPSVPPTASLTSPQNNSSFTAPATISLSATATASSGTTIQRVEFYNGTTKIGEDLTVPYSFTWTNVGVGTYTLKAVAVNNNAQEGESSTVNVTVQNQITPPTVAITQPTANAQFYVGDNITINASVTQTSAAYLSVNNTQTGWVKLKMGYNPDNLWSPMQNAVAGGNNTLEITLKDFGGNANWSSIKLYPQGNINNGINMATYWAAGQNLGDGWKRVSIPLSDFDSSINFSSISYIEFPHSANAGAFNVGISDMTFTGGAIPFVWFGSSHLNISTNATEGSAIPATLVQPSSGTSAINRVDFYDGTAFIGSDTTYPYSYTWSNATQGAHTLTAVAVYNGTSTVSSLPVNINVAAVQALPGIVTITATFATAPTTYSVQKAPLRYNKDFAYSLTLDDGLKDAYTTAFKLLNGGTIVENGNNVYYSPLKYTDGCGNDIVFTGGVAWNSANILGDDNHVGNSSNNMLWSELDEMYTAKWDVLNHSWSHAAYNLTPEQYNYQITENVNWVRNRTANAIEMTQFVVPSGDSNYYPYAFNNNMRAVYSQFWQQNYQYGFNVSGAVNMNNLLMTREFISDEPPVAINKITDVANNSVNGARYWWADFTHGCGLTSPISGNIQFSTFKNYLQYIASQYGKNGSDRVWAASLQEVQEYLTVREATVISSSVVGNQLVVNLDINNVPENLRHYALSLAINANASFTNVQVAGCPTCNVTYNGNQWQKQLINLSWLPTQSSAKMATNNTLHQLSNADMLPNVIRVVPNPAQSQVTLKFSQALQKQNALINFYNTMGKLVTQKQINIASNDTEIKLDLNDICLEQGVYVLDIEGELQHFHGIKLVKQ